MGALPVNVQMRIVRPDTSEFLLSNQQLLRRQMKHMPMCAVRTVVGMTTLRHFGRNNSFSMPTT